MDITLDHFVVFTAFILTSSDGKIDEKEKKVLLNHPMIADKLKLDIDPLFDKYEEEIGEKKEKLFFEQFKPLFINVEDDFKYEFLNLLRTISLADDQIDNNELKILNSISSILEFDEEEYLNQIFEKKELEGINIPIKYNVLKISEKEIIKTLSKLYKIRSKKGKNTKINTTEIGTEFNFPKWDNGQLDGRAHDLTIEINYRKFKDTKYGHYFMQLNTVNTDGGYYDLENLKIRFGDKSKSITLTNTSNYGRHEETSTMGAGENKRTVTIFAETIQFSITPFEFKKIIELNNDKLEFMAVTHTSNLDMSLNLKYSLITLYNITTNSNFKIFEIYKKTETFKNKIKSYNDKVLEKNFLKIESEIKSLNLKNLNIEKVKDSFLDNTIWNVIKDDEKYVEIFESFTGKKYLKIGSILSIVGFCFISLIGWWFIAVLLVISATCFIMQNEENNKKFKAHKTLNKFKFDEFDNLIKNNKPKLLK
tara:strand:- start:1142 stop:2578 length:1437 start_codon:yes stop_codon:yes gene_type:complete